MRCVLEEVSALKPDFSVLVLRFGGLGLVNGEWPIIGNSDLWNRADWPIPVFIRREPITLRNWLVYYSDTDPRHRVKEVREPNDRPDLREDSLAGYGAVEALLERIS